MAMLYTQNFSAEEFREWAEDMSPRLITMLDCYGFALVARLQYQQAITPTEVELQVKL